MRNECLLWTFQKEVYATVGIIDGAQGEFCSIQPREPREPKELNLISVPEWIQISLYSLTSKETGL